jgi:hypothetical protein
VLLLFLIILLIAEIGSGEFSGEITWITALVLIIKLILIGGLIALILVQRNLNCEITAPTGCTEEVPDPVAGILTVTVMGTASGIAFGSYVLEVTKGSISYPGIVSYPGGTATGSVQVVSGVLGTINTTSLTDGAYTITLRVYPFGWGVPSVCSVTFDLLKAIVYMNRAGGAQAVELPANNPNPFAETAELAVSGAVRSIGGVITIKGSAYIYECAGRKIKNTRSAMPMCPYPEASRPSRPRGSHPGTWPAANTVTLLDYTPPIITSPDARSDRWRSLINTWTTFMIGGSILQAQPGLVEQRCRRQRQVQPVADRRRHHRRHLPRYPARLAG